MTDVLVDVETDGLEYTKIHCLATEIPNRDKRRLWTSVGDFNDYCYDEGIMDDATWVAHNGCGFDFHVLNDLTDVTVDLSKARDTIVLSKLRRYNKFSTHSLKELGIHYRVYKGDYTGGWGRYTPEMGDYCLGDVGVLRAIYDDHKFMLDEPQWQPSVQVEHDMAYVCREMELDGFSFNEADANGTLDSIMHEMGRLQRSFKKAFPDKLVLSKTNKLRKKDNGDYYANVINDLATYPKVDIRESDGEYDCYEYKEFNPGSPRDRIDVLWDAGWKPHEKTKGHILEIRKGRR